MDDLTGKTLGRYQVLNLVGRGGMATVYKAKDPGLSRTVALKLLHAHLAADPTFVARFRREARAVAALRHPNIVQVYDFDSAEGLYFMVMEFVDGPTLATLLKRLSKKRQRLSAEEILRIFPPLCSAIDYANHEGMVHRDIKPSNIILTRKGDPVLTDYGIARIAGATSYTMPGTVVGSAQYMSPEQAQGQLADNRSDIYSLGICLFEALTGRVPFDGETTATILAQHLTAPVPVARLLNPELPPEVEAVLHRVLSKDPALRYQQAADLSRDLDAALRPMLAPAGATLVETVLVPPAGATRIEQQVTLPTPTPMPPPTPTPTPYAPPPPPATPPPAPAPITPPAGYPAAGYPATTPGAYPPGAPAPWGGAPAYGPGIYPQAAAPSPGVPMMSAAPAPRRRRRWPLVLVLVLVLAAAGIAAFILLRPKDHPVTSSTVSTALAGSTTTRAETTATTGAADAAALAEADSLMSEGKIEEAISAYQALLTTNPKNDVAQTQLGIAYATTSDRKEDGEKELAAATETNPSNAKAWTFLGMVRYDLAGRQHSTDFKAVEDALNKGIALDPKNARAHGFLAQAYAAEGRVDEALAEANKAVDMAPDDVFTVSSLGYVHAMRNESDQAAPLYQKAVALQPNWAWLQLLLAEGFQSTEKYTEALAAAETALKLGQGYEARAYRRIGLIYRQTGDTTQAEAAFKKSLELDKTDDLAQWGLGALWYEKGDYQNALSHLKAAATLSPTDAGYQSWLGYCYEALSMFPEARAALEKSLQLDPEREDAQKMLDQLTAEGH